MNTEHPMITKLTESLEQVKKLLAEGATVVPTTVEKDNFLVLFQIDRECRYQRTSYDPKTACLEWGGERLTVGESTYTIKEKDAVINGSVCAFLLQDGLGRTFTVATNLATRNTRYVYRKPGENWKNGY